MLCGSPTIPHTFKITKLGGSYHTRKSLQWLYQVMSQNPIMRVFTVSGFVC